MHVNPKQISDVPASDEVLATALVSSESKEVASVSSAMAAASACFRPSSASPSESATDPDAASRQSSAD